MMIRNDMTRACLIPALVPDLWHLAAIIRADMACYMINEPFSRKSQAHRMKLRNAEGTQWFTMPIYQDDRKKPLNEVRIDNSVNWQSELMKVLRTNYGNSIFYDFYEPEIKADLEKAAESEWLLEIVSHLNKRVFRYLELDSQISDKLKFFKKEQFDPIDFGKSDVIWIEPRGSYYRKLGDTGQAEIQSPEFTLPEYRQHFDGFEPGCCLLDLLFQKGPLSFEVTDQLR
ncbi:MAG: WbqC family protein [Balneolia bacterium]|nr:WbqC family protein [Balneolia bacterium]